MKLRLFAFACLAAFAAAESVYADSTALTNAWQATSSGDADKLIDVFVHAGRKTAQARSSDGRGPLFWAYEFKNVEALALLLHLGADDSAEDLYGKIPRDQYPDSTGLDGALGDTPTAHFARLPLHSRAERLPAARARAAPRAGFMADANSKVEEMGAQVGRVKRLGSTRR